MKYVTREGTFRGIATGWEARTLSTGTVVIDVTFEVDEIRIDGDWRGGTPAAVKGGFFPLKRTGAPNEKVVQMLCAHLGWDGRFQSLTSPPKVERVQIDVEAREHNGKTFYQANWVRGLDDEPAQAMDFSVAAKLDQEHGKALSEIAKKCAPQPSAAKAAEDDIPF